MQNLSVPLENFLLQIELIDNDKDSTFGYTSIVDQTNEYKAQYFLKYPAIPTEDLTALRNEIKQLLEISKHHVSDEVITGLLVLFTLCNKTLRSREVILEFFNLIGALKIKQYLLFDGTPIERIDELKFFDYTIGELDYEKIAKFIADHSGSDYATRYKQQLQQRVGIAVKSKIIAAVDVYQWLQQCQLSTSSILVDVQDIINIYLTALSNKQYEVFKKDFYEQQNFITASWGLIYGLEDFEYIGCTFINVLYGFMNNTGSGWVFSTKRKLTGMNFPDPRLVSQVAAFLKSNSEAIATQSGPFSRLLNIVSEQFSNGEQNIKRKNFDHAYIDLFVGLDFLLSPDSEKSKKLKSRISFLIFKYFNKPLREQVEHLDKLYDKRSEYIHNGKKIDMASLLELRDISKVILMILLNLHKQHATNPQKNYEEWLSNIDFHWDKYFNKGIEPNQKQWMEIGVHKLENIPTYENLSNTLGITNPI
jgi:hypothetical protein